MGGDSIPSVMLEMSTSFFVSGISRHSLLGGEMKIIALTSTDVGGPPGVADVEVCDAACTEPGTVIVPVMFRVQSGAFKSGMLLFCPDHMDKCRNALEQRRKGREQRRWRALYGD